MHLMLPHLRGRLLACLAQHLSLGACFFPSFKGLPLLAVLCSLVARVQQLLWLLTLFRLVQRKQQQCCFLCSFLFFGQDSWAGSPPGLPGFGGGPLPLFFPLGLAQLFGSGEGHLGTQGVPLAQGLPLIQGLLALITIGYPFVQGFDLVFQGFARQKREKTSLT